MITIKLAVMVKMMIMVQMAIEFYLNFIQISGEPGPFTTAKNGQSFLNHMKTIIEINNVDSTSHFFYEKPKVLEGGRGCTSSAGDEDSHKSIRSILTVKVSNFIVSCIL